jgi:hypothetical protein
LLHDGKKLPLIEDLPATGVLFGDVYLYWFVIVCNCLLLVRGLVVLKSAFATAKPGLLAPRFTRLQTAHARTRHAVGRGVFFGHVKLIGEDLTHAQRCKAPKLVKRWLTIGPPAPSG